MTKIQILDFVVDYYKSNPRAIEKGVKGYPVGCRYITTEGFRCAHSICIDDSKVEEVQKFSQTDGGALAGDVINEFGDEIHKPEFRGHEINFWRDVQSFHDTSTNWSANGLGSDLSEIGVPRLNILKERYKNN